MSDGSLSQSEIESLLAGLDPGISSSSTAQSSDTGGALARDFTGILESVLSAQSQNLSMITGTDVSVSGLTGILVNRDSALSQLPDEVLYIKQNFTGGLPGGHGFLFSKDTAIRIAALANKDESLSDIDDMVISIIAESVSNITGTFISLFSEKLNKQGIQSEPAEGSFIPKASVKFPQGNFILVTWNASINSEDHVFWEVYPEQLARDIAKASGFTSAQDQPVMQATQQPMSGQMQQPMMGQGMMEQPMMGQMQQPMMGGQAMMQQGFQPMYQQPMMGMQGVPPNVQPVQFGQLGNVTPPQEYGNIGLIMDVHMELTVELGRAKMLVKEILGLGEGNIIELDKLAGEPVDILVNHKPIAKGEVVVIEESFGVRVTEILPAMERMMEIN